MTIVTNPKTLRRSNKTKILFKLQSEGGKSRRQLAEELNLTPASITQLVQELSAKGFVVEEGSIQRNNTGRREVFLHFNSDRFAALSINIEKDRTHLSICNYDKVIEERIFHTNTLLRGGSVEKLAGEAKELYDKYINSYEIMGLGAGITGSVDVASGISLDSLGILPAKYPLLQELKKHLQCDIKVINNVKAQARALISSRSDNFMYVKHSPGIGCALVSEGKIVEGFNGRAGELGHAVVRIGGRICDCGRRGCLETEVSEQAITDAYALRTGQKKSITEIYSLYGTSADAKSILNSCVDTLALAISNAAFLNDPRDIMVTGGLFFHSELFNRLSAKIQSYCGRCGVKNIGNEKKIKAFAGARHILLEKLFEV